MQLRIITASSRIFWRMFGLLSYCRQRNNYVFYLGCSLFMFVGVYFFTDIPDYYYYYMDQGTEVNLRLYRDVYTQDRWPRLETNFTRPGELPFTAHYHWCEEKVFRFEDYLSVLSIVRIIKPQKIVFHYSHLPAIDSYWYHSWFQELKQSVPNFVLRKTFKNLPCDSKASAEFGLEQISAEGGIFIGERTIVTQVPKIARFSPFYATLGKPNVNTGDVTQGVIYSMSGFHLSTIKDKMESMLKEKRTCLSVKNVDRAETTELALSQGECMTVKDSLYPKDIWNSSTAFGEFSRWLFYGKRQRFQVQPDPPGTALIPMISHMVWLATDNILKSNRFKLLHYLSVLSALHVGGFEKVYLYGDIAPFGEWWDTLMTTHKERVTFFKIEIPETIFQQRVRGIAHQSDVLRLNILLRHGGAYQDRDVLWVSKVPDEIRRYQAVACVDWPQNGEWPEVFNMGVMMAKQGAQFLKHWLQTFTYYRDDKWMFNAVQMPYKAYELHPDTLYVDRYLQVICFRGICHPGWHKDYKRGIDDKRPISPFDWREARAFHFTLPKPPPSLESVEALRKGTDIYAQMGRMILEKGGRGDLLK